jgi:hypothetical protein
MAIKFFELNSIDGKRFTRRGEAIRNVRIDHNSTVTLITERNDREANVDFRFTANYTGVGVIKIEGSLIYEGDGPAVAQQWSKQGNMPDDVASEIHTTIMTNCIPEAVIIARDLRLPPPIPVPQVNVKGKAKPSTGAEVA